MGDRNRLPKGEPLNKVQTACAIFLISIAAAPGAKAGDRKYTCVPTHEFICVNMTLPTYHEGCQKEVGREHTLTLTIDLEKEVVRLCYSSDGHCVDEKISVDDQLGNAFYITRTPDREAWLQEHGVLNLKSMTYGETRIDYAAGDSLIVSADFFRCVPAL